MYADKGKDKHVWHEKQSSVYEAKAEDNCIQQ